MKTPLQKSCAWLIALAILLLCLPLAAAEEMTITPFDSLTDTQELQQGSQLVIGATTPMSGHFGTDGWSMNAADMDARSLLHGYSLVSWTRSLGATINSAVVLDIQTTTQEDGSRRYLVQLQNDLAYSDGTPITAADYAFSLLLNGSAPVAQLGGTPQSMEHVVGYSAYQAQETNLISGVQLVSDLAFSIQVKQEALPFFYGIAMLDISPYPMTVLAPGCQVKDDGQGIYLEGPFTMELLAETLLDPQTGYEFAPAVTTGPYRLVSYDGNKKEALFTVNPNYKGNYEGVKPNIETLVFRYVQPEEAMGLLESGEIGLLNKMHGRDVMDEGKELVYAGGFRSSTYLRAGMAYLSFACEAGTTADVAVRRAVAMCMDGDGLVEAVGSEAIQRVYGHYGLSQWMPTFYDGGEDQPDTLDMRALVSGLAVEYSPQAAGRLLEEAGWSLNESGAPYTPGQDEVRYRQEGDALQPLTIRWAKTEGSPTADLVEALLQPAMAQAGMRLEVYPVPFGQMMKHFFRQEARLYDMFFLATNFSYVYDPYGEFHTAERFQGAANTTGLQDGQLMQLALSLRETAPYDMRTYAEKWYAFQQRFVEMMPMVPLYSSAYMDVFTDKLAGYDVAVQPGWGYAILYAYLEE